MKNRARVVSLIGFVMVFVGLWLTEPAAALVVCGVFVFVLGLVAFLGVVKEEGGEGE